MIKRRNDDDDGDDDDHIFFCSSWFLPWPFDSPNHPSSLSFQQKIIKAANLKRNLSSVNQVLRLISAHFNYFVTNKNVLIPEQKAVVLKCPPIDLQGYEPAHDDSCWKIRAGRVTPKKALCRNTRSSCDHGHEEDVHLQQNSFGETHTLSLSSSIQPVMLFTSFSFMQSSSRKFKQKVCLIKSIHMHQLTLITSSALHTVWAPRTRHESHDDVPSESWSYW